MCNMSVTHINFVVDIQDGKKKLLSDFYQMFTSSVWMYMEFKSVGIFVKSFFVSKIGHLFSF